MDEKRGHKRFGAKGGTFAVLGPHVKNLGRIIDISKGGLAFSYHENGEPLHKLFELDILLGDNGFYLDKVPFNAVWDFQVVIDEEAPASSLAPRRCGVQFGALSDDQESQLDYFIQNHTLGEA